jgi:hypothetical protein
VKNDRGEWGCPIYKTLYYNFFSKAFLEMVRFGNALGSKSFAGFYLKFNIFGLSQNHPSWKFLASVGRFIFCNN